MSPAATAWAEPSKRLQIVKKSRPADMCGWTGHIQGNLTERVCEPTGRVRGSTANFVPRRILGGKNFCPATAGRNGFPLERVEDTQAYALEV